MIQCTHMLPGKAAPIHILQEVDVFLREEPMRELRLQSKDNIDLLILRRWSDPDRMLRPVETDRFHVGKELEGVWKLWALHYRKTFR